MIESASFVNPMENSSQLRMLLVDGDNSVLRALEGFLRDRGYNVTALDSGTSAMRRIREDAEIFDLVLTDLGLPDAG